MSADPWSEARALGLPELRAILDAGTAPAVNEEFIKQRAHLIEETLASFGAPAQVVEISRGPSVTQFGVEPLFVETRGSRTRVRVSKIASLADARAIVARSVPVTNYEPRATGVWDEAAGRFGAGSSIRCVFGAMP